MKPATNLKDAMRQLDERGFCDLNKLLSDAQLAEMRLRITRQAQYEREIGSDTTPAAHHNRGRQAA